MLNKLNEYLFVLEGTHIATAFNYNEMKTVRKIKLKEK